MDRKKQRIPVTLYHQLVVSKDHDPELPPIILLHGTGAAHSTWNRVSKQLANKTERKVYSVDIRNHGKSGWSEKNSLNDHQADLENFLIENDIKKCILIGHSLGGKIAMSFALQKPELVEKVVAEEVKLSNPSQEELTSAIEIIEAGKKINKLPKGIEEADIRNMLSRIIAEKYPHEHEFAFLTPLKKNCDGSFGFDFNLDVIEKSFKDRTAFDIDYNQCQKFTGPALIMYAKSSMLNVDKDEKIKEFFPNAELCKFETAAHVLHVEKPDEFTKIVSSFINK